MATIHSKTPLIDSLSVGKTLAGTVWLKMEALQPCGSFKARGVGYACEKYVEQGASAFVSSSGGNAGLAVAYSGRRLGIAVTVVVPSTTKKTAIELIELEGATVIVYGDVWNEAHQHALSLSGNGTVYIHPFDDPYLWQGHASIIDEVVEAGVMPDAVVLSVGGGGLLCGVVQGLQRNNLKNVPILAVETQGAESLYAAAQAKEHIGIDKITSIATSLGATKVAKRAFAMLSEHSVINHLVTDREAVSACSRFLGDHRIMVEPACGASLSAVYAGIDALKDKQNILVIVCGGVGVNAQQLASWQQLYEQQT
jgi:L-serine/L-threonine ammonia-lyase